MFNKENKQDEDFGKSVWGKILLSELKNELLDGEKNLKLVQKKMIRFQELDKFTDIITRDIEILKNFEKAIDESWDKAFEYSLSEFNFERWPTDRNIVLSLKDEAKSIRDKVKSNIKEVNEKILLYNSEAAYEDIFAMYETLNILKNLSLEFGKKFKNQKKEKNIVDFNDIEHYALNILVKKDENGNLVKTEVAKKYTEKFVEIAIDEYQDSNKIQEQILTSISNGKNIFAVGDVKQSIYKFRRACPELFLKKYEDYDLKGNEKGLKIQLFKNFRSRKNILDLNNNVFESIMSKELGDIEYNEDEFLNLGASFDEYDEMSKSEVYVIENNENEEIQDDLEDEIKQIEKEEIESKFVARRIKEMINKKILVTNKNGEKRPIKYSDIVILLRSTKIADIFERELLKNNIPVFTDGGTEYLETIEINTMINLLKILDNPLDDIPFVAVLRSVLFNFTDNEIIEIRLINKNAKFFDSINEALEKLEDEKLKEKIRDFIFKTEKWRKESEYMPLSELIWKIYMETGYYNFVTLMPNGALRQANLKMLFERAKDYEKSSFKGLFNFIRFIEKLKIGSSDLSSAKVIGENENVVRIMSIHKSKGLEFPVVFLSNASKNINFQDLKGDVLFHDELGIGPEYINYERKIKYSTAGKQAIKFKLKEENISEEMRILYVALTRAKEKLIITAFRNNEQKKLNKKKEELKVYINDKKINPLLVKKYTSYLDWIELAHLKNEVLEGKNNVFKFNILNAKEILNEEEIKTEEDERVINFSNYKNFENIENKLNWKYSDSLKTTLPIKSTVSVIKELENTDMDFISLNKKSIGLEDITPQFLNDEKIYASKIGTLTHLVLQKIDFNNINSKEDVKEFINKLIYKNFMIEKEAEKIDCDKIFEFLNSDLGQEIKNAKKICKEKPFYMEVDATRIFENAKDEKILVQGIIDLFFENENGEIILVDYKTDYIAKNEEKEFVEKYKVQINLYKQAIEETIHKKVSKSYLYSLYLNKKILVN